VCVSLSSSKTETKRIYILLLTDIYYSLGI
jgi:hypothetical protein